MRYQELREGLSCLGRVGKYLYNGQMPADKEGIQNLILLREAASSIREELKHPERFNLDGTKRVVKVWPSTHVARIDITPKG